MGLGSCFYEMACARKNPSSHSESVYRYNSHQLSKESLIVPSYHSEILVLHKAALQTSNLKVHTIFHDCKLCFRVFPTTEV